MTTSRSEEKTHALKSIGAYVVFQKLLDNIHRSMAMVKDILGVDRLLPLSSALLTWDNGKKPLDVARLVADMKQVWVTGGVPISSTFIVERPRVERLVWLPDGSHVPIRGQRFGVDVPCTPVRSYRGRWYHSRTMRVHPFPPSRRCIYLALQHLQASHFVEAVELFQRALHHQRQASRDYQMVADSQSPALRDLGVDSILRGIATFVEVETTQLGAKAVLAAETSKNLVGFEWMMVGCPYTFTRILHFSH